MVWAMDGFKSGGQGAGIKNPYIDYNSNFWFGHYTSGNQITPNYSSLNNNGESLGSKLEHMVLEMMLAIYINGGPTQHKRFYLVFNNKMEVYCDKMSNSSKTWNTNDLVVSLKIKKSGGSLEEIPVVSASNLSTPTVSSMGNQLFGYQEIGTTSTHPNTKLPASFSGLGRTGWMATHLSYNQGTGNAKKTDNNSGVYFSSGGNKVFRTFGTVATTAGAFDIYFRIGLLMALIMI